MQIHSLDLPRELVEPAETRGDRHLAELVGLVTNEVIGTPLEQETFERVRARSAQRAEEIRVAHSATLLPVVMSRDTTRPS